MTSFPTDPASPRPLPPPPPVHAPSLPAPSPTDDKTDRERLAEPRRVSPVGPIFNLFAVIRQIGAINIGIFAAVAGSGGFQLVALAAAVVILIVATAQWFRFRYWLDGDDLIATKGVLSLERVTVPLERVQSVTVRQNLLHRVLDLVEVKVETAGAAGSEIELTAVRRETADRIRRLSTRTRTSSADDAGISAIDDSNGLMPAQQPAILTRTTAEIAVAAVTRNALLLFAPIPAVLLLAGEVDAVSDWIEGRVDAAAGSGGIEVVATSIGIAVILSIAVVVLFAILRLHGLTVAPDGGGFRQTSGLISKRGLAVSLERIQMLSVLQNPIEKRLKTAFVRMPVVSQGLISPGASGTGGLALPGTHLSETAALSERVLGTRDPVAEFAVGQLSVGQISKRSVLHRTWWLGVVPALIASPVLYWFPIAVFAQATWVAGAWLLARRYWSRVRWELTPELLVVDEGLVSRRRSVQAVRKTQTITLVRNWFHRRNGLANLVVANGSRQRLVVPYLPVAVAQGLRDELLYRCETDPRLNM